MFTKNIVIETLKHYRGSHSVDLGSKQTYKWISMLPDDKAEMEPGILYVCMLSEAVKLNAVYPGFEYLCIRDRFIDEEENSDALRGIFIINENKSLRWLFNLIQRRFMQIEEWVMKMRGALIENCDYQRLIDLSEPILNNFVAILDSSHKLIAFSKNMACKNQINISLIEKGYLSDDILAKLGDTRRFGVYEQEHDIIISPPIESLALYEAVSKLCRFGGEWQLQVVMECSATPLSPGTIDLFDIFIENINICFTRQQHTLPSHIYSSLLTEMLYDGLSDPFIIGERAKTADIPFYANFNAYRISFEDRPAVSIGRFVQDLTSYLPKSMIVSRNYEVSVLNIYSSPDVHKLSSISLDKLAPFFRRYGALCGVSETFQTLPEFYNACLQASRAQMIGVQLRTPGSHRHLNPEAFESVALKAGNGIFHYDDVYMYLMLGAARGGTFDAFRNTMYVNILEKLQEYDKENNTRLFQVLYAHLISERRATATGKLLHIHRNNVLYHISRIEEITSIDLNDYWVRLKLLLAYHFLELQESNKNPVNPDSGSCKPEV